MPTYVLRQGKFLEKSEAEPLIQMFGQGPMVISDTMDATRHMANNRFYTSKAEFRKATKAAGCIETGTEVAALLKPRVPVKLDRAKRREDIKKTIYNLKNGRA